MARGEKPYRHHGRSWGTSPPPAAELHPVLAPSFGSAAPSEEPEPLGREGSSESSVRRGPNPKSSLEVVLCLLLRSPINQPAQGQSWHPHSLTPCCKASNTKCSKGLGKVPDQSQLFLRLEESPWQGSQHAYLPNLSLLLKSAPLLNSKLRHSTFLQELGRGVRHGGEGSAAEHRLLLVADKTSYTSRARSLDVPKLNSVCHLQAAKQPQPWLDAARTKLFPAL